MAPALQGTHPASAPQTSPLPHAVPGFSVPVASQTPVPVEHETAPTTHGPRLAQRSPASQASHAPALVQTWPAPQLVPGRALPSGAQPASAQVRPPTRQGSVVVQVAPSVQPPTHWPATHCSVGGVQVTPLQDGSMQTPLAHTWPEGQARVPQLVGKQRPR